MATVGHAVFADRLARFAAGVDDARVVAIAARAAEPVTVAVGGRRGVGRDTVARALAAAGVAVGAGGDVDVRVVAEVVKPEDRAAITASTLVVQNKADLTRRAIAGAVPMAAHLAVTRLDDETLRALAVEPLVFEALPPRGQALDRFAVAHAVEALRAGADVHQVLCRQSGVDAVVAALRPRIAEASYRRVRSAAAALEAIHISPVADFLREDDTVLGLMAAAVDVVEAAGMTVDPGDSLAAHLCRARMWDRYRRGPVNKLHVSCGDDIVRGSLRLWRRATHER